MQNTRHLFPLRNDQLSIMLTTHSNIDTIISSKLEKLRSIQPGGAVYERAMQTAIATQLTTCTRRIHTDGQASDGSDIGQYNANPMYVNPQRSPVPFQPLGKTGRDTFIKSGKPHLTRYFDQGYRAYREEMGLTADRVVLTLSGALRDGLMVMPTSGSYALGWSDAALYDLSQALEAKYQKPIWAPTADERAEMLRCVRDGVGEGAE
jgi:hypothetical protein